MFRKIFGISTFRSIVRILTFWDKVSELRCFRDKVSKLRRFRDKCRYYNVWRQVTILRYLDIRVDIVTVWRQMSLLWHLETCVDIVMFGDKCRQCDGLETGLLIEEIWGRWLDSVHLEAASDLGIQENIHGPNKLGLDQMTVVKYNSYG